jgi:ACT domain-containing protein
LHTVKAVITVVGKDRVGIIAGVSQALAARSVNILDISQTILQDYFTMLMLVDVDPAHTTIPALADHLTVVGDGLGVQIRVQHEDIFTAMHRV